MRKLLLTILLVMPSFMLAQDENNMIKGDMSVGASTEGFILFNLGVKVGNWMPYLALQMNLNTPVNGTKYTGIISESEFSDNVRSRGSFYDGIYGAGVGYFFLPNFEMGVSIGYASMRKYENRYDKEHILSETGYYYIDSSDGGKLSGCGQITYYFKRGLIGAPYMRVSYDNVSHVSLMAGLNF